MTNRELRPLKRENLSEGVYSEIQNALMEGRYKPGERLKFSTLAVELGVSITPVREAIFRLVSDRALEMKAATAIHVPEITADQLREIQTVRILLEGEAAFVAASKITDAQLKGLQKTHQAFQSSAVDNPILASSHNRKFHFDLIRIAKMPILFATVENMWVMMGPLLRVFHESTPAPILTSRNHYHFNVIDGLRMRDCEKTRSAMQDDIRLGLNLVSWIDQRAQENR